MIRLILAVALVVLSAIVLKVLSGRGSASESGAAGPPAPQTPSLETAIFAGGCFWGTEAVFRKVPGVLRTQVGYAGGKTVNPTYEQVCTSATGHAEAVKVEFDPRKVSYRELLEVFFENHDPTTANRQGPDVGSQYRSAIFFNGPEQERLAKSEKEKRDRSGDYAGPLVTEVVAAGPFYPAEEYHQQYFAKRGADGSCHLGNGKKPGRADAQSGRTQKDNPPAGKPECSAGAGAECGAGHWKEKTDAEWRAILTPEQYRIAREAGTERAFSGKYWNTHTRGVYRCAACANPLFSSEAKFDSGTGWPSFTAPISGKAVENRTDRTHGMARVEVRCSRCAAHLGHVFDDGPPPARKRYCMNSAVLDLAPAQK